MAKSLYKSKAESNKECELLANYANGLFFKANPMHFDLFPGSCQMEAEIIKMWLRLYKGSGEACGILDSSEADCVRDAVYSYRNWAREEKGITKPNILAPNTFDPSLDRAWELMDVEIRRIPVNNKVKMSKVFIFICIELSDISWNVDEDTIAIFCSAPDGVFGVFGKKNHIFIEDFFEY